MNEVADMNDFSVTNSNKFQVRLQCRVSISLNFRRYIKTNHPLYANYILEILIIHHMSRFQKEIILMINLSLFN